MKFFRLMPRLLAQAANALSENFLAESVAHGAVFVLFGRYETAKKWFASYVQSYCLEESHALDLIQNTAAFFVPCEAPFPKLSGDDYPVQMSIRY